MFLKRLPALAIVIAVAAIAVAIPGTPWPGDTTADMVLGQPSFFTATSGSSATAMNSPENVKVNAAGKIFVADFMNNRVLIFNNLSDGVADLVLGQSNLDSNTAGTTANKLTNPHGVAFDSMGRVYVADLSNNRVLIFNPPSANGESAVLVLGQTGFGGNIANIGANGMAGPAGVAVAPNGKVLVADRNNHRVLVFNSPSVNGESAIMVLGQPNFDSNTANTGGISANSMNFPVEVVVDAGGKIFVADLNNNRVLIFNDLADATADAVLGQPNFALNGFGTSPNSMNAPHGIAVDSSNRVFVTEVSNNRALIFNDLVDIVADGVVGQPRFNTSTPNNGGLSGNSLNAPHSIAIDATGKILIAEGNSNRVLVYDQFPKLEAALGISQNLSFVDTTFTHNVIVGTSTSYAQFSLPQSKVVNGQPLVSASNAAGMGALWKPTSTLMLSRDQLSIPIWSNANRGRVFLSLRSDTESLTTTGLPAGINNTDRGRRALGATAGTIRFSDWTNTLIGNPNVSKYVGDSFAYTLQYVLSETTTCVYSTLGFNTSAGSDSFRFYRADTYGAAWVMETGVIVSVASASPKTIVTVTGVIGDGVGGLGGPPGFVGAMGLAQASGLASGMALACEATAQGEGSTTSMTAPSAAACLIQRANVAPSMHPAFRVIRDRMLDSAFGRFLTALYYFL